MPKTFSFESENLNVDWISLNLKGLTDPKSLNDMALYLSNFGFNSRKFTRSKDFCESLILLSKNKFKVDFRVCDFNKDLKNYWCGTTLVFSGCNGKHFYETIKCDTFDWDFLNSDVLTLGRFDLNYIVHRTSDDDQNDLLETFMLKTCSKNLNKIKSYWIKNGNSHILRVGVRRSSNYYRVYENSGELKFELELKNKMTKLIENFLFSKKFLNFEDQLSKHFYKVSVNYLYLETFYTDWLTNRVREILVMKKPTAFNSLVSDYLVDSIGPIEDFMELIQFLSFIRTLNVSKDYLFEQGYYLAEFPVKDFLEFKGIQKPNQYTVQKTVKFFQGLQQNIKPLVTHFSDTGYRSCVIFPLLKVNRDAGKPYMISFALVEELYLKDYPFSFPNEFFSYDSLYELYLKFEFIQTFCSLKVKKQFDVQSFLKRFNLSNKNKSKIKFLICSFFVYLTSSGLIEEQIEIIFKNNSEIIFISQLTPKDINKIEFIHFYEVLY